MMEVTKLNEIASEAQKRLFIKYLDALIQKNTIKSFGSSYYYDEKHVNESQIELELNGGLATVLIRIISSGDGNLECIEYDTLFGENFCGYIKELILKALMQALSSAKGTFYRRYHYCYIGPQLDGEYWIKKMRIAPVHFEENTKGWGNIERYISIEFEVEAIDESDANAVGNKMADICAARLSFLLDIGIYPPRNEHKWFLSEALSEPSILRQTGFYGYGHQLKRMPRKKEFCQAGQFHKTVHPYLRYTGDVLKLPTETRKLFTSLEGTSDSIQRAFNQCCFLYQLALTAGRYYPTVELSYLVAAVEALAKSERDKSNQHFSAFVRSYSGAKNDVSHLTDFMHGSVRSAHFHAGEFIGGEYDHERMSTIHFSNVSQEENEHNFRECRKLLRYSIANWVTILIANPPQCES
ncbi:hypothetical protein [Aeromonas salmonicida]|uniref:hypothetical protein n=1 Tax=Aeromonas salmonicida TaxID=645 RepID=UPI003D1D795E